MIQHLSLNFVLDHLFHIEIPYTADGLRLTNLINFFFQLLKQRFHNEPWVMDCNVICIFFLQITVFTALKGCQFYFYLLLLHLDPVVQSIVSLTISLRHKFVKQISAKVTNTLLFFVEKM